MRFHSQNPLGEYAWVSSIESSVKTSLAMSNGLIVGFGVGVFLIEVAVGAKVAGAEVNVTVVERVAVFFGVVVGLEVAEVEWHAVMRRANKIMLVKFGFFIWPSPLSVFD